MSSAAHGPLGGWRSRTTFVLAMSASAIGLGNLWRFSYLAGENGGGPFVLTYVLCLFLIAVPVLIAEVVIGSHGRGSPGPAMKKAADRSLVSRGWRVVGLLACVTGLLILSYYIVIAGWAMAYAEKMQSGEFSAASAVAVGQHFEGFLNDPREMVYWQTAFLATVAAVLCFGVRRGLGLVVWIVVPAVFVLLGVLVDYSLRYGDLDAAQKFLFSVQMLDFNNKSVLVALGQAFYTLSVGVGIGISYGAYAPERLPVGRSVVAVAVFDTLISITAGLALFPIVFANNIEPSMGPGLMFVSLPYAFGNMAEGEVFGFLFFVLVAIAALGSAVALLEPITGYIIQRTGFYRVVVVLVLTMVVWVLGLGSAFSFNVWEEWLWFGNWNFFQLLDISTAELLLPLVSLLLAIFVGWRMRREILRVELYRESALFFSVWLFLLRYIAPLAIVLILVSALVPLPL
ncbi:MAG: sodium-dependent transporter [Halioglobus sp.]